MKPKKKPSRHTPPARSSGTLLDFFNTNGASSARKSKGRQDSTKQKSTGASSRRDEVIVIDSDSDDADAVKVREVTSAPAKRRKLSPPQPAPPESIATNSFKTEGDCASTPPLCQVEPHTSARGERTASESKFGDPFLLAARVPVSSTLVPSNPETSASSLWNDPPIAGPSRPRQASPQNISRRSPVDSTSCPQADPTDVQVDIDLTTDSWEVGDDENAEEGVAQEEDPLDQFMEEDSVGVTPPNEIKSVKVECIAETSEATKSSANAFSRLMTGVKENQAWKEADKAEDRTFRPTKSTRRKAPFYKVLQGMPIAVDAFKYGSIPGVTAYFLTHAHSDHYTNLSSSWKSGPIYCSEGTANLIIHMLSVDKKWVHPLPMDTPVTIPDTGGVQVTLIEANHCPGSCLFLFEGRQTVNAGDNTFKSHHVGSSKIFRYLHCGDFRASPRHVLHPAVKGKRMDHVYLDTTYLDPKYTFPPQALVISACAELAGRLASGAPPTTKPSGVSSWLNAAASTKSAAISKPAPSSATKPILFVVGTYSIGKERIVKAVAKALNSKIYCDKRKAAILRCQADPELDALLTSNAQEASIHLLPLGMITSDKLAGYFNAFKDKYSKIIGFRPTGWTYVQPSGTEQLPSVNTILNRTVQKTFTSDDLKPSKLSTSTLQMYPVPYSEHSSFYELTCFAMSLDWSKMIATVNVGSEKSRGKMARWVSKWEAERKKRTQDIVSHRHLDYW